MSNESQKRLVLPKISEFYNGKSVFITGATGFLGVVLVEALLRLCPGLERIYILVREKKGIKPESRKELIFNKAVFSRLKNEQPDVFTKVYVVEGDVSQLDLGMDEISLGLVIQNVNVVFHCAASINFLKPLRYMLSQNSGGTQNVIDVCKKIRNLNALVYTSTAMSNCNRNNTPIEETIYRLPFHSDKFLDAIKNGSDSTLQELMDQCQPPWPNYYTFSKSLAENIVQDNAADLPTVIVRPSIIGCIWKEPLPGYVEDTTGITALSIGTGKGFVMVLHGDPDNKLDFIPADAVAHTLLIAAIRAAIERSPSPPIVNCTSYYVATLGHYTNFMMEIVKKNPLPNTFRKPTSLKIAQSDFVYWLAIIYEHYIPAFVFDFILKLSGSKIRLIRTYKFVHSAINATHYFMTHSWNFQTENFKKFMNEMHPEDKELLGTSSSDGITMENVIFDIFKNAPFCKWEADKKSRSDRMLIAKRRLWLTNFVKGLFIMVAGGLMYLLCTQVFQIIYST